MILGPSKYNAKGIETSIYIALPEGIVPLPFTRAKIRPKEITDLILHHLVEGTAIFIDSSVLKEPVLKSGYENNCCIQLVVRKNKAVINKEHTIDQQLQIFIHEFTTCDYLYIRNDSSYLKGILPPAERRITVVTKYLKKSSLVSNQPTIIPRVSKI